MVHGGAVWWIEVCGRIYMLSYFPPILAKHDRSHYGRSPMCTYHRLSAITHCTLHGHCTLHITHCTDCTFNNNPQCLDPISEKGWFSKKTLLLFQNKLQMNYIYSFRTCCHSICHQTTICPTSWPFRCSDSISTTYPGLSVYGNISTPMSQMSLQLSCLCQTRS